MHTHEFVVGQLGGLHTMVHSAAAVCRLHGCPGWHWEGAATWFDTAGDSCTSSRNTVQHMPAPLWLTLPTMFC
jgi:hypothetical protein